jgi:hypothetical protein
MSDKDNIQLTKEELDRVNKIISEIQSDLNLAIDRLKEGNFEGALQAVNSGITKSNCPICKRELGVLIADIVHNKDICILKAETCKEENQIVIDKTTDLKNGFIPITQTKKALKDKKKDLNKLIKDRQNYLGLNTDEYKEKEEKITLNIHNLLPPLPKILVPKWFKNTK